MIACPAAAWPFLLHRSRDFFHGEREGKVKKQNKQKKSRRGEAKTFVEAEEGAEIRLACICPFQFFGDIKGKQGCEAGEKKAKQRNYRKDGKQIQSKGN